jgi:CubicO group peptidase (beta-lactamase class C family)
MQLVERGKITLDEPVYRVIPELAAFNVVTGFTDSGVPIEEKHKNPITLRQLLTHSSGLTYDNLGHPKATAWLAYHKQKPASSGKLLERFVTPLMFEPGESWAYGPGIDFAGLLVERLSGLSLEEYMKEFLWGPCGVKDATFFLSKRPDLKERLADMSVRTEDGKVRHSEAPSTSLNDQGKELEDCFGGQGSYTCVAEYIKVLRGVLDGTVLSEESLETFFAPQLGAGSREMLNYTFQQDEVCFLFLSRLPTFNRSTDSYFTH